MGNSCEKATMDRDKLAALPTCVPLTFMKSFGEVPVPDPRLVDAGSDVLFQRLRFQMRTRQRFRRQLTRRPAATSP